MKDEGNRSWFSRVFDCKKKKTKKARDSCPKWTDNRQVREVIISRFPFFVLMYTVPFSCACGTSSDEFSVWLAPRLSLSLSIHRFFFFVSLYNWKKKTSQYLPIQTAATMYGRISQSISYSFFTCVFSACPIFRENTYIFQFQMALVRLLISSLIYSFNAFIWVFVCYSFISVLIDQ